jgi:hypothetical protein
MVAPFYTTGKWQKASDGGGQKPVGREADLMEMVNTHGSSGASDNGSDAPPKSDFVPKKAPRKL